MSVSASTQIPKTSDDAVFQRQCKVLFEYVLNDPHIEEFGTSGQNQGGIDLLGRRRDRALDHWVGIQCKLTIKAEKLKTGVNGVVEVEATRALDFTPPLKEFIIATTANNDGPIQREAALFTDKQAKLGRDFTVQVWGWETLSAHILRHEATLNAFMPDAFPQLNRIIKGQERLTEEVGTFASTQNTFAAEQSNMLAVLARIERQTSPQTVWDDRSVDTLIDRQIDQFRDMINSGRPRTALTLLEGLWRGIPEGAEHRIRFRIKANIAACLLRLGEEPRAAEAYLEAHRYAPNDPKAIAMKVVAHVLLGQPQEALAFGRAAFTGGPDQGPLVAYMITAAKFLPGENSALELITDAVADDAAVASAKIDYLRSRGEPGAWWDFAVEAHARHPDDENLLRAAAESHVDRSAHWAEANDRRPINAELRTPLEEATVTLEILRERYAASEFPWDVNQTSLSVNLAIGYRLLRQHDKAKRVVEEALRRAPNDRVLNEAWLTISLESGDHAAAQKALKALPESRDVIVGRLQLAANSADWSQILRLNAEVDRFTLDDEDRALLDSLSLLAQAKVRQPLDAKAEAAILIERYANEPIVPTILHELAMHEQDALWALELFRLAFTNLNRANSATRMMLARLADREDDAEKMIALLDGYVDVNQDSAELRSLARAFVNAAVRQASVSFINALPPALSENAFYARAIGSIHFNRGDLPAAAEFFQKALLGDVTNVAAHLGLINTWLRQDRRDLVGGHLEGIDLRTLKGPPQYKMGLAQLLVAFEQTERGLSFGYDVALKNRTDQRTVMLYIGMILPNPTSDLIPSVGSSIGIDCWVKAERADGLEMTLVIEDNPNRNEPDHFGPDHRLSRLFLGQAKNATVVSAPTIGTEEKWRIVEIKHKYLALLHEFIETLPSRFPDAKGFHRFEVKGDDVSNVLAEVKRLGEQEEQIFRHYVDDNYPLALVASFRGKSTVEFASHVISRGEIIRTCLGSNEERDIAVRLVRRARSRGVVLDTYTVWVAQQLGLLGLLKRLFSRVAVPRSVIDELREWQKRIEPVNDNTLETIGYANGQHFREEISAERLRESAAFISSGIDAISAEVEILPAVAPGAPSEIEEKLLDLADHGFLDPIYVSVADDLLLLSDDLQYRALARQLHDREGVWLQAVLMVAQDSGIIDLDAYSEATYELAARRHSHVSFTAYTLISIALRDTLDTLPKLEVAAAFIGGEAAEVQSHIKVTVEFIAKLWNTDLPYLRKAKATSIMLDRLVAMLARLGLTKTIYLRLVEGSRHQPLLRDHLIAWARGHFIDLNGENAQITP
jgi:cellulose synthase operon protein C